MILGAGLSNAYKLIIEDDEGRRSVVPVELGAMFIHGTEGNPMTRICNELGFTLQSLGDRVKMLDADGSVVDAQLDERMERKFNAMLDAAQDQAWKEAMAAARLDAARNSTSTEACAGFGMACGTEAETNVNMSSATATGTSAAAARPLAEPVLRDVDKAEESGDDDTETRVGHETTAPA